MDTKKNDNGLARSIRGNVHIELCMACAIDG